MIANTGQCKETEKSSINYHCQLNYLFTDSASYFLILETIVLTRLMLALEPGWKSFLFINFANILATALLVPQKRIKEKELPDHQPKAFLPVVRHFELGSQALFPQFLSAGPQGAHSVVGFLGWMSDTFISAVWGTSFWQIHVLRHSNPPFFPGISRFFGAFSRSPGFWNNSKINVHIIETHVGFSDTCGNGL